MATITPTKTLFTGLGGGFLVQWTMGDADTGVAVEIPLGNEKSVQWAGTFGSGTFVFNGSNDGTNYVVLTDPQGNALSKTAAAIEAVSEHTRYVRPSSSGGTGATVVISLFIKGQTT